MTKAYITEFLKQHTIEDVAASVVGELNEYATEHATYFFGNGELIVMPVDAHHDEFLCFVDTSGAESKLVKEQ